MEINVEHQYARTVADVAAKDQWICNLAVDVEYDSYSSGGN